MDRPASLNNIKTFQEVLGMCVMVVSARLGNKFITSPSMDEQPCIYCRFGNVRENLIFANICEFVASRTQSSC